MEEQEIDPKRYVFFLGGHDAEMIAIRNILKEKDLRYHDNNLSWGANVKDYVNEYKTLKPDDIPVLIELKKYDDLELPPLAQEIDHHGEKAGKDNPTSIEQIADMLKITLTREQQLISANDRGYITELKKMGATEEEITKIRQYDKECQGVTTEDEKLAEKSLRDRSELLTKDCLFVDSLTNKTSPVTDRIYGKYKHVFIKTPDNQLTYSGSPKIISRLCSYYRNLSLEGKKIEYWSGGNMVDEGFFGAKEKINNKEIEKILSNIPQSHHIFLFPFKISPNNGNTKNNQNDFNRAKDIYEILKKGNSYWKYAEFELPDLSVQKPGANIKISLEQVRNYNEWAYFYEYAQKALYNLKSEKQNKEDDEVKSYYFEWDPGPNPVMTIYIKDKNVDKIYDLEIDNISLRIFQTGIGILGITLYNHCYTDLSDILLINDFGRRIYPQFIGNFQESTDDVYKGINAAKDSLFADKIVFKAAGRNWQNDKEFTEEDFLIRKDGKFTLNYVNYINDLLKPLIENNDYKIELVLDDRMFTVCWYGNEALMNKLKHWNEKNNCYGYENSEEWYRFIFIDGKAANVDSKHMLKNLIKKNTYDRFVESGTIYGISRYSFVCLTDRRGFGPEVLRIHMETMYYQLVVLVLAQRAAILHFQDRVDEMSVELHNMYSNSKKSKKDDKKFYDLVENINQLDAQIIIFKNRLSFEEVTAQEQGIELYSILRKEMNIPAQMEDLQSKIKDLHNYVDLQNERRTSKTIKILTEIGTLFLPVAVLIGLWTLYFTMDDFLGITRSKIGFDDWKGLVFALLFILSTGLILYLTNNILKNLNKDEPPNTVALNTMQLLLNGIKGKSIKIILALLLIIIVVLFFTSNIFNSCR